MYSNTFFCTILKKEGSHLYAKEYIEYLVYFHGSRDYFECHEVLEEYWKKVDKGNKDSILVAFILLAVSCYHHRRKNFSGAFRTLKKARNLFLKNEEQLYPYGIEKEALFSLLNKKLKAIEAHKMYQSFILPIFDPYLLNECEKRCKEEGVIWAAESDLTNEALIHKHKNEYRKRKNTRKKRTGKE